MASRPASVAAGSSTNEAHEATTEILYENQRSALWVTSQRNFDATH